MDPVLFAFHEKLAAESAPVVADLHEVKDKLKPGDILVTRPIGSGSRGKLESLLNRAFVVAQKSEFTHTGLYAGNGQVVDAGLWPDHPSRKNLPGFLGTPNRLGVAKVPLKEYVERYAFKVLRPEVAPEERKKAADFAEKQVGKKFNLLRMVRAGLPASAAERARRLQEDYFCSELVANAYHKVPFSKERGLGNIRPIDILKSDKVKVVAEFNPELHKTADATKLTPKREHQDKLDDHFTRHDERKWSAFRRSLRAKSFAAAVQQDDRADDKLKRYAARINEYHHSQDPGYPVFGRTGKTYRVKYLEGAQRFGCNCDHWVHNLSHEESERDCRHITELRDRLSKPKEAELLNPLMFGIRTANTVHRSQEEAIKAHVTAKAFHEAFQNQPGPRLPPILVHTQSALS